jgi:PHD/YefM family antitoxin component YafN of YafNO toxin-antitoxin module
MKTVAWTEHTAWEATVRQAEHEEVVVMRDGHAVALLMPFDDDDLEWYARQRDPNFVASIAQARRQVREGRTIGHDDLKRELGLD